MNPPKMKTVAEDWGSFEKAAGLDKTSAVQRSEMKKAFYAGAYLMMANSVRAADIDDDFPGYGTEYLESVEREFHEFVDATQEEKRRWN